MVAFRSAKALSFLAIIVASTVQRNIITFRMHNIDQLIRCFKMNSQMSSQDHDLSVIIVKCGKNEQCPHAISDTVMPSFIYGYHHFTKLPSICTVAFCSVMQLGGWGGVR